MFDYGTHFTGLAVDIDNPEALDNETHMAGLLRSVVASLRMTILGGPYVHRESSGDPDRDGVSGVILLCESHAAAHGYPARSALFVDVFSCRPFDISAVTDGLADLGNFSWSETRVANRGIHWNQTNVQQFLRSNLETPTDVSQVV